MARKPLPPNAVESGRTSKRYTSFGANIDLTAAVPTGATDPTGTPCRRVRINAGAGVALSVQYADGSSDTIPGLNAGDQLDVQASQIVASGSTVTDVSVFW